MGCSSSILNQVSTDLRNPPEFKKVDCKAIDIAAQQKVHPDLKPFTTSKSPAEVFAAVQAVCAQMFSEVVDVDAQRLEVECVDVTKLMKYKDDVIVRVSKTDGGSQVDVRSRSRVGKSDLGKNALRVSAFFDALRTRLK
eukprot:jgi/Tetstr1/447549/TSEL_034928.t1